MLWCAADNALHHCFRSSLQLALEHGLRCVALSCVYVERKRFPRLEADQLALRTVRRFLERHPQAFDKVGGLRDQLPRRMKHAVPLISTCGLD